MAGAVATLKAPRQWYANESLIDKSHKENIFLSINAFRRHKAFTDVVVYIAEREFHAHRLILASSSPVLETMLSADMKEKAEGRINLTDSSISPLIFEDILSYMYSGKIKLSSENVEELLFASTFLMMEALNKFCEEFLKEALNINNCLGIREIASKYACQNLFIAADLLLQKEFLEIAKSDDFDLISKEELCRIIAKDELEINSEDEIFASVLKWINKKASKRYKYLKDVLLEVRVQFLSDVILKQVECISEEEYHSDPQLLSLLRDAWQAKKERIYGNEYLQVGKHIRPRHCLDKKKVIFCCGGYDGSRCMQACAGIIAGAEKVHPLKYMKVARQDHSIACLDGCLYVVGGFNSHKGPLDNVECFNPIRNEWRVLPSMNAKRKALGLAVLNGKIYATGGLDGNYTSLETAEVCDPRASGWQATGSLNEARYSHCLLSDDKNIYAVGGWKLASVERFNPQESSWELVTHMSGPRAGATAELVNGRIYVFGGRGDNGCLSSAEVYDIRIDQWITMPDASVARWRAASCCIDGSLYIIGGRDSHWQYLDLIESFDVNTQKWNESGRLYTKLMGLCCSSIDIPFNHLI